MFTIFFFHFNEILLTFTVYNELRGLMSQANCMWTARKLLDGEKSRLPGFLESNLMQSVGGEVFHFPL